MFPFQTSKIIQVLHINLSIDEYNEGNFYPIYVLSTYNNVVSYSFYKAGVMLYIPSFNSVRHSKPFQKNLPTV